ncbi:glycoside hydrolase family 9 protein [Flammeovirga aprica]|uniref:Endoglucanase n=1 Tax=Flammeovirga aprica JL-4 TaxID=694437 RepID=A0A7X9P2I4_9BACT|nr:glycoside hydrolase family 9 protein [Flammeovirga aprica]NME68351.1 cellulase [Flammeovirga aprica JL-4]
MKLNIIITLLLAFGLSSCGTENTNRFRMNQEGYFPTAKKIITVKTDSPSKFLVYDEEQDKNILAGDVENVALWEYANESYGTIDISEIKKEGTYKIWVKDLGYSEPFEIRKEAGEKSLLSSIEAFYLIRCSTPIEEEYAGVYARPEGHPDTEVLIHPSALKEGQDPKTTISSARGWYDAGDYNKYVVNSGISTYSMLLAFEQYGEMLGEMVYKIPHENKALPLYLDNVKWNLDWLVTMQDVEDGGVYHKLTNANFDGIVMPHKGQDNPRYVVQKTTAATLDFAAVMACAARIYKKYDEALAEQYQLAAVKAYQWAEKHPAVIYDQNKLNETFEPKVNTGAYDDKNLADEWNWAATELYILTKDDSYYSKVDWDKANYEQVQSWGNVAFLPLYSLAHNEKTESAISHKDFPKVEKIITQKADLLYEQYKTSSAGVSMGQLKSDFVWGSNSVAANQGMLLLNAYKLNYNSGYIDAAVGIFDYLLGRNPLKISYLTGAGTHQVMHPHHRISEADTVKAPYPGLLIGGPQNENNEDCEYPYDMPATKFSDTWCSYSTNEIAINWNASFVYLMAGLNNHFSHNYEPLVVK